MDSEEEYLECVVCWYCGIVDGKPKCLAPSDEDPGLFFKPEECWYFRPRLKLEHEPLPFAAEPREK